ncbi:MAG TPA: methylated-DNA--[protein]-cysteine S-methyltransferase [Flavisolibacter sp.]|jgi:AraC family transcriptional regulator of adaptative response/methylated-DNA-[protein]-cysteine methyltransferase|nr:methylated-DNA--[protein]-cysteine S-methyltransferase [Flavisolibacter sp.]
MESNYERIETAIHFLHGNFREQPDLDAVAAKVYLSPYHFNRLFREWAGVTPKKFLQYLSLEYAKKLLQENHTLESASFETGLSGTGRLHDLFITIEGMTPGEYKNGGAGLLIHHAFISTPFGTALVAATDKGICSLQFTGNVEEGLSQLHQSWPNATFSNQENEPLRRAKAYFTKAPGEDTIPLHLKGTPFQLKVWEALLKIPPGRVATYSRIAHSIAAPKAFRAVGSAIGSNPVAVLIPCHRVIQSTGVLGNYHWGPLRKKALIGWEAARNNE